MFTIERKREKKSHFPSCYTSTKHQPAIPISTLMEQLCCMGKKVVVVNDYAIYLVVSLDYFNYAAI